MDKNLFKRIKDKVDDIPIIDIHTHLRSDSPVAKNLADILFYNWVERELFSVGISPEKISRTLPAEERIINSFPYLKFISNTSTYRCLLKIFKDLYGFIGTEINKDSWKDLNRRVMESSEREDWFEDVFLRKAKVEKSITANIKSGGGKYKNRIAYTPEISDFFYRKNADPLNALARNYGEDIDTVDSLEKAVVASMERVLEKNIVGVQAWLPVDLEYREVSAGEVRSVLKNVGIQKQLTYEDKSILTSFILFSILNFLCNRNIPFQIALGADIIDGKSLVRFRDDILWELSQIFNRYQEIKFTIFLGSVNLSHQLSSIAKQLPNVYVSGYWWHALYPLHIKYMLQERLEMVPMPKFGGEFSDAYFIEWSYAKLSLIRQVLAEVLAEKVRSGFYDEDFALSIAKSILCDNPKRLYDI